jgi:hypothetical protein
MAEGRLSCTSRSLKKKYPGTIINWIQNPVSDGFDDFRPGSWQTEFVRRNVGIRNRLQLVEKLVSNILWNCKFMS